MSKTIIMIHGMCGGEWVWENYKLYFEQKGYRCITTTLRYHDMRPDEMPDIRLGTTRLADYIDDLEKEITKLDELPIVMGHSMGGFLAQVLASRRLAKAIVSLTPGIPYGFFDIPKLSVIRSLWSIITKWGWWKKPARQTFEEAVYSILHLLPPEEQKMFYSKFVYDSGRMLLEFGFDFLNSKKAKINYSNVVCPILIIAGSKDRLCPASSVKKLSKKYTSVCTYKEFANHAHWVIGEPNWQEITEFIYDWLNRCLKQR